MALEAVKSQQTLAELSKKFELNSVVISKWKSAFLENLSATFEKSEQTDTQELDSRVLYATISQLKVENEFLKPAGRQEKLQEVGHRDLREAFTRTSPNLE